MFGYCSNGLLLGRYMILYANASDFELGLIFMIHPMAMFARPLICARADRHQNHKQLLCLSILINSLAYIPFIAIPYIQNYHMYEQIFTRNVNLWILCVAHALGSVAFCGVRSLGDALAVNYAKRVGDCFGTYRKYGALGYGSAGFLIGLVNQNNGYLPDYVPAVITNVVSLFVLCIILYNSSDHYFLMVSDSSTRSPLSSHLNSRVAAATLQVNSLETESRNSTARGPISKLGYLAKEDQSKKFQDPKEQQQIEIIKRRITTKQQLQIFFLLMKYDIRIPLFFLLLFVGGLLGYAPPNYVYTYMDKICSENEACDSAFLSGSTMLCYCAVETLCYMMIRRYFNNLGHALRLQITLISLAVHFFFYAFAIRHLSPYFFMMEILHGLEYSISLTSSVELGYKFANEVGLLMPELLHRNIIGPRDDPEMVRLSLTATMNSCFTLLYEGAGTMAGVLLYGFILDRYSFETVWLVIGVMSVICFLVISLVIWIGKLLHIEPKILSLWTFNHHQHPLPTITYS